MREELTSYYDAKAAVETIEENVEDFHKFCAPEILKEEIKDIREYKKLMEAFESLISLLEWQNKRIEQLDDRVNDLMLEKKYKEV